SSRQAFLAFKSDERLYHLVMGYKLAGDILVQESEIHPHLRNKLIFPVLFTYRHFVELRLKGLLSDFGVLANVPECWSTHDLGSLWERYSRILVETGQDCPDDDGTTAVKQCVIELSKVDSRSDSFRYPRDRRGRPIDIGIDRVDLVR